jgi:DNA-binding beta-propeller fold protein YncE
MKNILLIAVIALFVLSGSPDCLGQTDIVLVKKWGEFGDKPGQFKFPTMVAADGNGDVYVVDQHNHRIQKFDSDGNFILMWGKAGAGPGEFNYPYGVAVDSKNNVYVSDMNNNRIQKFSPAGAFLAEAGSYGTADAQLKYPYGITVDDKDVVYVIDAFNYKIKKFDSNLRFVGQWGSQEAIGIKLYMPHEIAVMKDGNILLSDRQNHRLSIFTPDGKLVGRFGEYGEGDAAKGGQFSEPHGVVVNRAGEIFVCDRYNFRIQKFSPAKEFQVEWMTSADHEDSRYFPLGIAASSDGNVYVTDHYAHAVHLYKLVGNR